MSLEWNIHYEGWMIEDGLPNRTVGEDFEWEIEFWTSNPLLEKSIKETKSAIPLADYKYQIVAQLSQFSTEACVIDFGLKAIGNFKLVPAGCKEGEYLRGEIKLGLSDGSRAISSSETRNSLRRKWHVNAIQADVTAYIAHAEKPRFFIRDESQIQFKSIWSTAEIRAHTYILHCSETL
jgi:hypothetical protein